MVSPSRQRLRSLEFDPDAFEDLAWWIEKDRAKAHRIVRLIRDVLREPFAGQGKPEPLKHSLGACWSRRIVQGYVPQSVEIPWPPQEVHSAKLVTP